MSGSLAADLEASMADSTATNPTTVAAAAADVKNVLIDWDEIVVVVIVHPSHLKDFVDLPNEEIGLVIGLVIETSLIAGNLMDSILEDEEEEDVVWLLVKVWLGEAGPIQNLLNPCCGNWRVVL